MAKVLDVAKYIALKYKQIFNEVIDEMKLHKLLYFAQREYLTKFNKPLFDEKFEAWAYGPVMPCVRNNLQEIISNNELPEINGIEEINNIILQYAPIDSMELSDISHNELSWLKARNGLGKYDKSNKVLNIDDIKMDGKKVANGNMFADSIDCETKKFLDSIDESELTEFAI